MLSVVTTSIQRNIGIFLLVLFVLVGGTGAVVKFATDHLLYVNATSVAHGWARYLAANVSDLEQIAAGEQPSIASVTFLQEVRKTDRVFRYEIFNREGFSQLVSDHGKTALVEISDFNQDAARSSKSGQFVIGARGGVGPDQPPYFAEAYVPVVVNGRTIAVVAAYVDQTEQRDSFYSTFLVAAASLCLLTGLSFAVPVIAWFRRTKEKQHADRRIRFLAHHDGLTGLANRAQLIEQLDKKFSALRPDGPCFAVHFLDLDRFKGVNDTFGHDCGDFLLKTMADRLRSVTRQDDVIARMGGDEFIVVQARVADKHSAEAFAHRLASALNVPMQFKDYQILATASVGVAMAPADGGTPERLLKSADLALYKSKADGRNCVRFFSPEMDSEIKARLELESVIRKAVLCDGFVLQYQPLFEMSGRRLIGYEALVRLPREDGTLIPPLEFIPVAEEMRLIDKIGAWVLREACKTAATWPAHLTVAVNLSPAQFSAGSVSASVASALQVASLDPRRLELEITESLLLGNSKAILAELHAIKALGVAIVMDDFGTGYSSLSYLWRFPFDKIKIDRSFMQDFDSSGRDAQTVVKTIIALGRELNMRVTVEGVETASQAEFLDDVHGDQAQGFYFGRPVSAAEIAADLMTNTQKAKTGPRALRGAGSALLPAK